MKILVVTHYFWPETFKINDFCLALKERGHEVVIYTCLPNYPQGIFFKGYGLRGPYREKFEGMEIYRVPLIPRGKSGKWALIFNYFSALFMSLFLAPWISFRGYDRIFVYGVSPLTTTLVGAWLKWLNRTPLILWITDLWPDNIEAVGAIRNEKILNLVSQMMRWVYQRADKILISSRGFRKAIESHGMDPHKIEYWPQWAEDLFYDKKVIACEDGKELFEEGFNIVFAGNIGVAQGFESILEAAYKLKNYLDIKFIIIGDGSMKSWMLNKIEELGLEKTFYHLEKKPLKFMPYYFDKADALLLTLKKSFIASVTLPGKLQTYLASGTPVIVGLHGEAAHIVEEWKCGVSASMENQDSLKEAILKLYGMSEEEQGLCAQRARECYEKEFDRKILMDKLEGIFGEVSQ